MSISPNVEFKKKKRIAKKCNKNLSDLLSSRVKVRYRKTIMNGLVYGRKNVQLLIGCF